jgi:hypothetical protein
MNFIAKKRLEILKDWRDNKENYNNSLKNLFKTGIQIEVADSVLTNDKRLKRWIDSLEIAARSK